MQSSNDIRLNLVPITFDSDSFKGYEMPYVDENGLKELRVKYSDTHVFRRHGNVIHCVPLTDSAQPLGKEKVFTLKNNFVLAEYLVQNALVRFFLDKKVQFSKMFSPTRIVLENENLTKEVVPDEEISGLFPMCPEYEVESRLLVPYKKPVVFGISVSFSVRHLIEATAKELIERGVDLTNLYVVGSRGDEGSDPRISPKYQRALLGKVVAVEGSKLRLSDFRDKDEVDAGDCFLEPSTKNFKYCLSYLFAEDTKEIREKRLVQIFKVKGGKNQYERLNKVKSWLTKSQPVPCACGLSFTITSDIYKPRQGNEAGEYRYLNMPDYVLRPGGSITVSGKVDEHIDDKGPFDTESFPKKRVRIAVVFPQRFRGDVETFIKQFRDGVPINPKKQVPYTQGFIRKYRLTSCEFDFFPIDSANEDSKGFKEASLKALTKVPGYDLAIIVIQESYRLLFGEENPYLVSKSTFMSQGVPVQEVEIETVQDSRGRPWILNNIALAAYAKLGGVPWVLSSTPGMTHELIFGIGSSQVQTRRLGDSERFVGITTVFSGDGNYLLYNLSKEVTYDEYQPALLQSLKDCLDEIKARYAWQPGDKVRLIFHQSFKKFRDIEAAAVKQFVDDITGFDVEYAFVHISKSHSWEIFDTQSEGVNYWDKDNYKMMLKGEYVPRRGCSSPLGPQAALLTLTGPYQLKTHLQGCPKPILVSVHKESTFNSQEYLINQIFKLTFMSWRSFFPSTMPVTIEYSDMIASLMGQLRGISNWNPDVLTTKLRESRWFL